MSREAVERNRGALMVVPTLTSNVRVRFDGDIVTSGDRWRGCLGFRPARGCVPTKALCGPFRRGTFRRPGQPRIGNSVEGQVVCSAGGALDGGGRDCFLCVRLLRVRGHDEVQAVGAAVLVSDDNGLVRNGLWAVDVVVGVSER